MEEYSDDMDIESCCYVSAPSSPDRRRMDGADGYYFYTAPSSPTHFAAILPCNTTTTAAGESNPNPNPSSSTFDFHFSTLNPKPNSSSSLSSMMTSADELFFNGQIRPMSLLASLVESKDSIDVEEQEQEDMTSMSRDLNKKFRAGRISSLPRRTRSMSPNRSLNKDDSKEEGKACRSNETASSVGRSSSSQRRWVFLEFLYRSKSEGSSTSRNNRITNTNTNAAKDKKRIPTVVLPNEDIVKLKTRGGGGGGSGGGGGGDGGGGGGGGGDGGKTTKRRVPVNYELHYTSKRAEAKEMRKKTFLPYRQGGLLSGCLGFSSRSFGANTNGGGCGRAAAAATSFNPPPVSSR